MAPRSDLDLEVEARVQAASEEAARRRDGRVASEQGRQNFAARERLLESQFHTSRRTATGRPACGADSPGVARDLVWDCWCDRSAGHRGSHEYSGGAQGSPRPWWRRWFAPR